MTYQSPDAFYLLALIPIIFIVAIFTWRKRKKTWKNLVASRLIPRLAKQRRAWPHFLTLSLTATAFAALVFALANPTTENKGSSEKYNPPARPVMIALDISRSMLTRDVSPDRLQLAKTAALEIVAAFPNAQIGLVIFSGEAWLQVPLTIDHPILRDAIAQLDPETLPLGGSDLALATKLASDSLQATGSKNNTLILLTDGEEHSPGLLHAGAAAASQGTRIHILGFGTPEGATIPDKKDPEGVFRDRKGFPVVSRLNEPVMRQLAKESGGSYARGSNPDFMEKLRQSVRESDLARSSGTQMQLAIPHFQWFLLTAILLIMFALLSRVFPLEFSKKASPALLAGLLFFAPERTEANQTTDALQAYQKSNFASAQEKFGKLANQKSPEKSARYQLAAATAAYRRADFTNALALFSEALLSPEKPIQSEARYALGNTLYQLGLSAIDPEKRQQWQEACEQYRQALALDPKNQAAIENLAFLEKKLQNLPPPPKEDPEKSPPKSQDKESPKEKDPDNPSPSENPTSPINPTPLDNKNPEKNPEKAPEPKEPQPDAPEAKDTLDPNESPEARARRIIRQHAQLGKKPPQNPTPLTRPEKDW